MRPLAVPRWLVAAVFSLVAGFAGMQTLAGQATEASPAVVLKPIFRDFQSQDWKVRAAAFYRLVHLGGADTRYLPRPLGQLIVQFRDQANQIHLQLIGLLLKENEAEGRPPSASGHWGEDYMNYYGDTILAVGLLGDPRAVTALAGAIETGGDATGPLASFGGAALPAVIAKFHERDPLARNAATGVMVAMLEPLNRPLLTPAQVAEIDRALRHASDDPAPYVRQAAMWGLAALGEQRNCDVVMRHMGATEVGKVRKVAAVAAKALGCGG